MSVALVNCRAQFGVTAPDVRIEVLLSGGLPRFTIVGLPETAVRESKDRVRGAIMSSGFRLPDQCITVSLAPADMRKTGGRFDLGVAVGILAASGQVDRAALGDTEFYGELALNGDLRAVPGVLPSAIRAARAGRSMVVPAPNASEAVLAGARALPAASLLEVTGHLTGLSPILPADGPEAVRQAEDAPDLADVRGQARARRALEIAAAGGHNLLFVGPPGTGKSMLARRLPGILPPLPDDLALETAAVGSVLGRSFDLERWRRPPFRAPHHSASAAALVGGGSDPKPGEVSRAHNGILFLDELPEWNRHVLEMLREPMETGCITISRASRQVDFPARFQLVAAMNPCPCGYLGDARADCTCSADRVSRYRARISGPLLDRIDLQLAVDRPPPELLRAGAPAGEPSADVALRVRRVRRRQLERAGRLNAALDGRLLERYCRPTPAAERLLEAAMERFVLSVRTQRRMLRVARTLADMSGDARIDTIHVGEALALRGFDVTGTGRGADAVAG